MSMARTTKILGFSVPPSMVDEVEQIAKEERRTKSELFRRMLGVYKTYRKQLEQAEEERFQRMIDEAIAEGLQEKENPTMSEEEYDTLEEELLRYGERQAQKMRITREDVDRIIREERDKRKTANRA
jgi:hypothetical protein